MKIPICSLFTVASFATFACSASAQVTLIQENFDNYGSSAVPLNGQSGGSSFSNVWTQVGASTHGYNPTNLTASATGYVNTGDAAGGDDGAASNNTYNGGLAIFNSVRAIAQPTIADGGTVWFSFTVNMGSLAAQNNALFSPFGGGGGDMFNTGKFSVGVTAGRFSANNLVSYSPGPPTSNFVNSSFAGADLIAGTTYLIVGRMTIDAAAGATDILDVWFNPTDTSSIASLGTAQVNFSNQDFSTANTPNNFRTSGSSGVFLNGLTVGIRGTVPNHIDSIRMAFGGNSAENFAAVIVAAMPTTTTTLASSANPSAFGDEITLTASVNSSAATGAVTFKNGATILASENLVNGIATFATSELAVGPHSLTAVYEGDAYYITSTSSILAQQVINAMTPLQTWYQSFSLPTDGTGNGANTADPDNDGIQNLVEYALGGNPIVSDASILPGSSVVGGKLQLSFSCDDSKTDITYRIEAGDNLSTWTEIARSIGGATTAAVNASGALVSDSGSGIRMVTLTDSATTSGTPKRFLRIKVTNP